MEIKYRIKKEILMSVSSNWDKPYIEERYYPMVNFGFMRWYYLSDDLHSFTYTENKQHAYWCYHKPNVEKAIAEYNAYWKYKANKDNPEPSEYNGIQYFYDEETEEVDINQTVNSCVICKGFEFPTKGKVDQETRETLIKAYQRIVEEDLQDCKEED